MNHYSDIENDLSKEELKKLKKLLNKKIGEMDKEDVEFINAVVESIEDYKKFFELLKQLSR
jgi:DNA-binding protein H-NS